MKFGKMNQTLCGMMALGLAVISQNLSAANISDLPDISALTPFTTFGNFYNDNLVTVNGDAGISANGKLMLSAPSSITGNLYLGTGVTFTGSASSVGGSIFLNQNLSTAQSQVFSASTALQNLAPDYTGGNITSGQTYTSKGQVTVINVNSVTLGSGNITLQGGANDVFVLNIAKGLSLTGSSSILGAGGVTGAHILVNLYDNSATDLGVIAHINDLINGTLLIPYDSATLHSEDGSIYSGNGEITLMSGAKVTDMPFGTPLVPDSASTLLLMGLGASFLAAAKKKLFR